MRGSSAPETRTVSRSSRSARRSAVKAATRVAVWIITRKPRGLDLRGRDELTVVQAREIGQAPGVRVEVFDAADAVDEDQIRTGLGVGARAALGLVPPLGLEGVRARDDDQIGVAPRVQRRAQLRDHVCQRDHLLALEEATALRPHLVFEVQRSRARVFVLAQGARHVESIPVAGVGVADHRKRDAARDRAHVLGHLRERQQAEIRKRARRGRAEAGHVDGLEARVLGEARLEAVVDERGEDEAAGVDGLAQAAAGRGHV